MPASVERIIVTDQTSVRESCAMRPREASLSWTIPLGTSKRLGMLIRLTLMV